MSPQYFIIFLKSIVQSKVMFLIEIIVFFSYHFDKPTQGPSPFYNSTQLRVHGTTAAPRF